jgi:hypothetical protein
MTATRSRLLRTLPVVVPIIYSQKRGSKHKPKHKKPKTERKHQPNRKKRAGRIKKGKHLPVTNHEFYPHYHRSR